MIITNIILEISYFMLSFFNLYFMFLILQENHYHLNGFILILKKEITNKVNYMLLILLLSLFVESIIVNIILLFIIILFVLIKLKEKYIVKLNITNRIKRMFFLNLLINILYMIIFSIYNIDKLFLIYLTYINLLISFIMLIPIETFINYKYKLKAKRKIKKIKPLVIGITGSAGKTSVKNYLYQLLKDKYLCFMTPKSYNTVLGICKSINEEMNELTEIAIIEYGCSHVNDIKKSLKIVKPDISIITNIGIQHLETFKKVENIVKEKCLLMENSKVHFYNKLSNYTLRCDKCISFSSEKGGDYYYEDAKFTKDGTYFTLVNGNKKIKMETNLLGSMNLINLICCISVCRYLNINYNYIKYKIKDLKSVSSRLELLTRNNKIIINDSFNSNKNGFVEAISVLNLFNKSTAIITPGIVTGGKMMGITNESVALEIINKVDKCYLVKSNVTKYFTKVFDDNNYRFKIYESFEKAYKEALSDESINTILIENDITDIYRRN